ncbi:YdeI/OmpD-associated family protein [Embleya sp. NPDC127516]|uniref:YdeI/OmpD-associated family protein n=1 Tax=Embleya sp. NPDC127516 TaxID=3363990 RepID=UPI00381892EC
MATAPLGETGAKHGDRPATGVAIGDTVEAEVELDTEPRDVVEPADFARPLDDDPRARAAYDNLTLSRKREHVRAVESAKKPATRQRRIEKAITALRG